MLNKTITANILIEIRDAIGYSNQQMAELLGISEKTWLNRISATGTAARISPLEYQYLLLLADRHPNYIIKSR
jgi:DNA-binding CsgD family transcriptional regulator